MQLFCQFMLRKRAFYTCHVHGSPYSSFERKKIKPIMCYEGINAKVFWHSVAFAIAVVVRSRSSSFEYTISVHAVHAGAKRNVCNIVVSTETPPNFYQSISNAASRVQTSTLAPASPQVLTSKTPTTFSTAFLCRCATDVSIRSRLPAQLYHLSSCIYVSVHESSGATLKMHKLICVVAHAISDKVDK